MANTLHGPYAKTTWTSGVTPLSAANQNNQETQAGVALASFNPDLIGTGFVLSGVTCAKDGSIANQLDVASGKAYLVQSDGTLARCDVASTTFTTSVISTTYYLDLNPDGSWSWATSHSAVTNHILICSVTTDGSGNIIAVTDTRYLTAEIFLNALAIAVPSVGKLAGQATAGAFGVPMTVGVALHVAGSGAGLTTILSYTVPTSGLYRVNCAFRVGTSGNITLQANYTDSFVSIARTAYFQGDQDGGTGWVTLSGGAITGGAFVTSAMVLDCLAASALAIKYQNSGGAGSDLLSVVIERLA